MTKEQSVIAEYLTNFNNGRGGKFLEIGAKSESTETKIRTLYERGWTGVLVQSDNKIMSELKEMYAKEPRIQLLQYDISEEGSHCMSMDKLLSLHGNDIDFINIDAEGYSAASFIALPQAFLHKLKAICIKHEGNQEYIESVLLSYAFRKVYLDEQTLIMVK